MNLPEPHGIASRVYSGYIQGIFCPVYQWKLGTRGRAELDDGLEARQVASRVLAVPVSAARCVGKV
jgi:hypothetical protein